MLCCTTLGEEAHRLLQYRMFAGMSAKIVPQDMNIMSCGNLHDICVRE